MADNLSKKLALFCCCLMTMQALRLVISTAGFCVVRFHIDCELFNIFISRLVNAVMMSQLFGNWLGDLIVFGGDGKQKLEATAVANWAEFICFCSALFCICHTECGHLTGFYWSMVSSYFWWKVGEAPATSIAAPDGTDFYFAGFTLSGVWAAILKGLVMRCVTGDSTTKPVSFHSDVLGDVNVTVVGDVSVVGARSVKTTVDYRATKWLFIVVIVLTFLMCLPWSVVKNKVDEVTVPKNTEGNPQEAKKGVVTADNGGGVVSLVGVSVGAVLAVPGAMLGAGVGWVFGKCCCLGQKKCQLIFGIVTAVAAFSGTVVGLVLTKAEEQWIVWFKWTGNWNEATFHWPMGGLGVGSAAGALVGLIIGAAKGSKKRGTAAGAFLGSFFGLLTGEIASGNVKWDQTAGQVKGEADGHQELVAGCGVFIVVAGLGTVYSIYPGMAPCSITQFKYFNIIDIWILVLSAIAPMVIMGVDLANADWKLGNVIMGKQKGSAKKKVPGGGTLFGFAVGSGLLMVFGTLVCEILVLDIMQHPHSKMAQQVTTSGWRACTLTIMMVTCQLTSSGVGFACVAAGSGFNDGVMNANSTLTLWTIECCSVLGEGYLTELKKYEPGKWPTQGMGKWSTYKWWNGKAFGNAWAIWCCIGTTDLRRDIMLCKQ